MITFFLCSCFMLPMKGQQKQRSPLRSLPKYSAIHYNCYVMDRNVRWTSSNYLHVTWLREGKKFSCSNLGHSAIGRGDRLTWQRAVASDVCDSASARSSHLCNPGWSVCSLIMFLKSQLVKLNSWQTIFSRANESISYMAEAKINEESVW